MLFRGVTRVGGKRNLATHKFLHPDKVCRSLPFRPPWETKERVYCAVFVGGWRKRAERGCKSGRPEEKRGRFTLETYDTGFYACNNASARAGCRGRTYSETGRGRLFPRVSETLYFVQFHGIAREAAVVHSQTGCVIFFFIAYDTSVAVSSLVEKQK